MPAGLKPGARLRTSASTAEFIVVRPPRGDVEITLGGAAVHEDGERTPCGVYTTGME